MSEKDMTDEEKKDLANIASTSKFTEISCVLASSKGDYSRCLNLYMGCSNMLVRLIIN